MDYYEAREQLVMLLRNGQISLDEYEFELAALKYAYAQSMSHLDDNNGVTA